MIVRWKDPDAPMLEVIDIETGKRIERVRWANDETGEYAILEKAENDKFEERILMGKIRIQKMEQEEIDEDIINEIGHIFRRFPLYEEIWGIKVSENIILARI